MKPILIFQGDLFETDFELERIKKHLIDLFRLEDVDEGSITNIKRALVFTVSEDKIIRIRSFQLENVEEGRYKNNLTLEEIGPSLDLKVCRVKLANADLYKLSCKQPKEIELKKEKNVSVNKLGEKRGRIHMAKQNITQMPLKHRNLGRKRKRPDE